MEKARNTQRMRLCRHFDYCDVVKCPLDELICQRVKLPEDKIKCQLSKGRRMRIGRDMETNGLNCYELTALVRTHGSLEMGVKAILHQNFCVKNEVISSRDSKDRLSRENGEMKGRLERGLNL